MESFEISSDTVSDSEMHEDPTDPELRKTRQEVRDLQRGMVFAIEPMIYAGLRTMIETLSDDWTVVTLDGKLGGPLREYSRDHRW